MKRANRGGRGHTRCHILAALFCLLAFPALGQIRVPDGDTFVQNGEKIRVMNIDAPEIHPCHCQLECDLGYRAKEYVERFLSGPIVLERASRVDKYGRTLARVSVDGVDLGEALIAAGLARPWEGRRKPWC